MSALLRSIRFPALLLAAVFCFQILEIPFPTLKANPKTCCGRVVCECTHGKGAFCNFKHKDKMAAAPVKAEHKPCHLPAKKEVKVPAGKTGLSKAPCASDSPKSLLPGYSRDFIPTVKNLPLPGSRAEEMLPLFARSLPAVDPPQFKRPPRVSFSF